MSTIQPVNFPFYGDAIYLNVTVLSFNTGDTKATTKWELCTAQGIKCAESNYEMTGEQFAAWGQDNSVVDEYVANAIGVVIVPPPPPPTPDPTPTPTPEPTPTATPEPTPAS